MIKWRHASDRRPPFGTVAIVAAHVPELDGLDDYFSGPDFLLMSGLYAFTPDGFVPESNAPKITGNDYWYCLERDLMDHLRAQIVLRTNGHGVCSE